MTRPTPWRRRCAASVVNHAIKVMGPRRVQWARAMRGELPHVPDSAVIGWALGCLWTSYRERLRELPAPLTCVLRKAVRELIVGLASVAAALGYLFAASMLAIAGLKVFLPERIGLWISPHRKSLGYLPVGEQAHDLLGVALIRVCLLVAVLCVVATRIAFHSARRLARLL